MSRPNVLFTAAALLCATLLHAQTFEEPPTLHASEILKPEVARGPNHTVRDLVPTFSGRNQYAIDSDFGIFEADGNAQLSQRVAEIRALAKLKEISLTQQYKNALKSAAESPVGMVKELARNPVKTVSGVPKGLWKVMNRAGQSAKEVTEGRQRSPYEDGAGKDLIGFSKAKRQVALQLGVDPYSSNEALQKELNAISWVTFSGKATMSLALAPVGGAAGMAITGVNLSSSAAKSLLDNSPGDLRREHTATLAKMKVPDAISVAFLNSTAYSPTQATLLVDALSRMPGVSGRDQFLQLSAEAADEIDALFFQRTAEVLAKVHKETPLAQISDYRGFPLAITKDGALVLALEWDYACWTEMAASFVKAIAEGTFDGRKITSRRVVLTGVASPLARQGLESLGIKLTEFALPGPLAADAAQ